MYCKVWRMFREGVEWPTSGRRPDGLGQFDLRLKHIEGMSRVVRVAEVAPLLGAKTAPRLPPLLDAVVLHAEGWTWSVTGFDQLEADGHVMNFRQTWKLVELNPLVVSDVLEAVAAGRQPDLPPDWLL